MRGILKKKAAKKNAGRKGRRLGPYGKKKPQAAGVVILCGAPGTPGTQGTPPTSDGKCPKCGREAESGFGLAYGGCGPYYTCSNFPRCPWYWKEVLKDGDM